ncbi:uncharacterized protein K452DRAFT_169676 [Aplosporella prunicola CBS 121167]|uniref:Zn(2)-C6 fungal-type domain-containing protein n=1 Tax=Aplosporella prunicola CBS 121167 TaxID=1176127 RepID=A0A6A6BIW2_9PEZI|nr:uncharacterized protein K452DRAFT_169676 [Aplosporella prunicola CBS 121167]KAF2143363.1 hypothetical protein K452DRAFT_169676 [Aplosporella prunicola CBS 121167]
MSAQSSSGESSKEVKKIVSRRSHKKSRNGCGNCKKRRIKCDETKPGCVNCIEFSVHCDFIPGTSPASSITTNPTPTRRRRGRPRKNWDPPVSPAIDASSAVPKPTLAPELDISQLELLFQFTTYTYSALAEGVHIELMWRVNIPQLGFTYHCVLHLILGLAALHLCRLRPHQRDHYFALAENYWTIGLKQASDLLPHLNADNCQAVYVSALLVCFYTFAKGPRLGDYLIFSENGPSEWFPLLRGVRSISEVMGGNVFNGPLAPMRAGPPRSEPIQTTAVEKNMPRVEWEEPIQSLHDFITASNDPNTTTYLSSIGRLAQCFEATYGKYGDDKYEGEGKNQVVMIWFYTMEEDYILCLQQKQPIALILLAYFCPLLKTLDSAWFMQGWPEHILAGTHRMLDEEHRAWVQWPTSIVGCHQWG